MPSLDLFTFVMLYFFKPCKYLYTNENITDMGGQLLETALQIMVVKVFELCKLVFHSSCSPNSKESSRHLKDISRVYGYKQVLELGCIYRLT